MPPKGKRNVWRTLLVGVLVGISWSASGDAAAFEKLRRDDLLWFVDRDGFVRPVRSPQDWVVRRRQILEGMQAVMGKLPSDERRTTLDLKTESEEQVEGVVRRKVSFAVEPGDRIFAYLMWPKDRK